MFPAWQNNAETERHGCITPATKYIRASSPDAVNTGFAQILLTCLITGLIKEYQANKGKGWGVIAQRMGLKPGFAEFHALKQGDLVLDGKPGGGSKAGKGDGDRKE